jgi:hypothetical protein
MPRYHFNVHDGTDHPDLQGTELDDVPAARKHAVRYFGEMLQRDPCTFWNGEEWKMEVANETGLVLFSLHFIGIDAPALR